MSKTTVLFVCPDNALLGPLAEAYLNARGRGLVRAFSAGLHPARSIHGAVPKLLSALSLRADGLEPKSLDVFLQPHAPVPDRVIYLADMAHAEAPKEWQGATLSHIWDVAGPAPFPVSFAACVEYFRRIRVSVDKVLDPSPQRRMASMAKVA